MTLHGKILQSRTLPIFLLDGEVLQVGTSPILLLRAIWKLDREFDLLCVLSSIGMLREFLYVSRILQINNSDIASTPR